MFKIRISLTVLGTAVYECKIVSMLFNLFFEAVINAVKEGKAFDEKAFDEELSKFEYAWTLSQTKYPVEPQPVNYNKIESGPTHPTYRAACMIYNRWMKE